MDERNLERAAARKGVLTSEDALRAVACGSDGVIVSNHGGRQLEGAPATLRVLPEIVEAVGDETEVLVDGGIRRGSDVVKAVATARAPFCRAAVSLRARRRGPAGRGAGARHTPRGDGPQLSLLGCPGVSDLDPSWLRPTSATG